MNKIARCIGQCCTEFILSSPNSPKYCIEWVESWLEDDELGKIVLQPEVRRILKMVIPVKDVEDEDGHTYTLFTCKNYNTQTGNCKIYNERPQMCKDYGVKNKCTWEGCKL